MTTAVIIAQKRKEKELTQIELAKLVGVSAGMIGMIERGTRQISLPLAVKFAEVFGCTVDDLCEGGGTK